VQGIPLAGVDAIETFAYDTKPPRVFNIGTVFSEGCPIARERFMHLAADCAKNH
jgi:hypothetical protein